MPLRQIRGGGTAQRVVGAPAFPVALEAPHVAVVALESDLRAKENLLAHGVENGKLLERLLREVGEVEALARIVFLVDK